MVYEFIEFIKAVLPVVVAIPSLVFILASIAENKMSKHINPIYRAEIKKRNQKQFNTLKHHLVE